MNIRFAQLPPTRTDAIASHGRDGMLIEITGIPGAGKTALANHLLRVLAREGSLRPLRTWEAVVPSVLHGWVRSSSWRANRAIEGVGWIRRYGRPAGGRVRSYAHPFWRAVWAWADEVARGRRERWRLRMAVHRRRSIWEAVRTRRRTVIVDEGVFHLVLALAARGKWPVSDWLSRLAGLPWPDRLVVAHAPVSLAVDRVAGRRDAPFRDLPCAQRRQSIEHAARLVDALFERIPVLPSAIADALTSVGPAHRVWHFDTSGARPRWLGTSALPSAVVACRRSQATTGKGLSRTSRHSAKALALAAEETGDA